MECAVFSPAPADSPLAPREMFVDTNARTLAHEILMMDQADYPAAFKGSAMKRAKLWMLQRNAALVLGNSGTDEDLPLLDARCVAPRDLV